MGQECFHQAGPRGPNWPNKLATFLCGSNQEAAGVTGGVKATEQRKKRMKAYRVSTEAAMDCIRRLGAAAAAGAFLFQTAVKQMQLKDLSGEGPRSSAKALINATSISEAELTWNRKGRKSVHCLVFENPVTHAEDRCAVLQPWQPPLMKKTAYESHTNTNPMPFHPSLWSRRDRGENDCLHLDG